MLMIWSFWVWIYDDLWAFISVSVFFQQFVCWFILILVHLVRWFESCWCKVHSHRICLSFSICFQSLLEIVAQVRKKKCSPAFCQVLPSKTTHLFYFEEKQNALNEVGGFNARNRHYGLPEMLQQQQLHSLDSEDFSTMRKNPWKRHGPPHGLPCRRFVC